jgi:hypothetical protein
MAGRRMEHMLQVEALEEVEVVLALKAFLYLLNY